MTSTTMQAPDDRAQLIGSPYEPQTPDLWELLQQGRRQNPTGLAFAALHHDEDYLEISKLFPSISTEWKNLEWTYDQLSNAAEALGSTLGNRAAAPSAIATFFYPTADWALVFWTAANMGAPFAPLDPKMLGREEDVKVVLDLLRPDIVLVHDDDAAALADKALSSIGFEPKLKIMSFASRVGHVDWLCMLDLLRQPRQADGVESTLPENPLSGDRIGRVLFTGGSTGAPKACPHSMLNLCAESEQYATLRDLGPASRTLIQSPCNHIMAYAGALLTWHAGGAVVLPGASFNARASLEAIEQYHVTYLPVHYSMSDALLADAAFHKHKVASVKYMQIGGALIGADLLARYHSEFADIKIFPFWGMTEGMYTTANGLANTATLREGVLAVGLVQPGGRVRVVDPDTGTVCRRGEVGELHIGGATVIKSYMHGASPASFYSDEYGQWFKSGDQGVIDELGQVHMIGRYKDVIKRGGENLYPQLAEHRLLSKTGIRACIVGVPDDLSHEVPVAVFDHTKAHKHITKLDMQQVLVSELGAPYALASILTLEEIGLLAFPVGPGGKIQKPKVREFVLQALADGNTSSQQPTTAPPGSLNSKVYAIVASHLGIDVTDLSPTLSLSGLLDSLTATRLFNTLEKLLGRRLALSTTAGLDSIEQIVRLCEASNGRSMMASSSSHIPPQLSDLSFLARKDLATFELLQQTVHATLAPLHMDWGHHVQDIFKVPFLYSLDLFAGAKDRGFLRRVFEINNPSSRYITQAIGRWLEHYHIFRSLAIEFENQPLLIRVKPCLQFRRACISYATIQDTETETFCDQAMASAGDQACKPPGTLIKIQIVSVANTAKSLLVLTVSHAVVDAVMMEPCLRDLDALLANLEAPLGNDLVDYKLWADMYDNLEESRTARDSAEYHAQYLRGFSKLSDAVWPSIHRTTNGTARRDSATSSSGDIGRIHEHKFEHLPYLFAEHGIRPATVLKAAVALANSRTTGHAQATFVDTNAGRVWPFQDAFVQTSLPNAWNVMGPTYTALFNIINIDMNGTCLKLLQDVHASTAEATAHCHTSLPAVLGKLGEEAALVTEFFTRQTLNITPDVRRFLAYRGLNNALVQKRIKAFTISPGVYWQCSFYDGDTLAIAVRADAGVVDVELAERMRRDIVHCMGGLCKPGVEARLLRDIA